MLRAALVIALMVVASATARAADHAKAAASWLQQAREVERQAVAAADAKPFMPLIQALYELSALSNQMALAEKDRDQSTLGAHEARVKVLAEEVRRLKAEFAKRPRQAAPADPRQPGRTPVPTERR